MLQCCLGQGGLAHVDPEQVQKAASLCLKLYDKDPSAAGAKHAQSQRFLNATWVGLDTADVPLREIVQAIANGQVSHEHLLCDQRPEARSYLHWVSGFRTALTLAMTNGQYTRQCISHMAMYMGSLRYVMHNVIAREMLHD